MNAIRCWLMRILATIGVAVLVISFSPLVAWWAQWLSGDWRDARGKVLIVPAGSALDQGILGDNTYGRCVYAIYAYREGGFEQIILTGTATAGLATSELMRDFLVAHQVPLSRILVETKSTNTLENARNVAPMVAALDGPKVLLTSDLHMFRALRVFHKAGIPVIARPFPEALKRAAHWRGRWPVFFDLAEESTKIVYYRWMGWI